MVIGDNPLHHASANLFQGGKFLWAKYFGVRHTSEYAPFGMVRKPFGLPYSK